MAPCTIESKSHGVASGHPITLVNATCTAEPPEAIESAHALHSLSSDALQFASGIAQSIDRALHRSAWTSMRPELGTYMLRHEGMATIWNMSSWKHPSKRSLW